MAGNNAVYRTRAWYKIIAHQRPKVRAFFVIALPESVTWQWRRTPSNDVSKGVQADYKGLDCGTEMRSHRDCKRSRGLLHPHKRSRLGQWESSVSINFT